MNARVTQADVLKEIQALRREIKEEFVTRVEFEPVRNVVFGLVALVLVAVVTALVAQVVVAKGGV